MKETRTKIYRETGLGCRKVFSHEALAFLRVVIHSPPWQKITLPSKVVCENVLNSDSVIH
jgi:hypothetical protein